jgi:Na+-driven multidrug efflux pump
VCTVQILGLLLLKVLQAQNEMLAPAILGIATFLVNIGMNFVFIRAYGFLGAPLATSASRVLFLIGSVGILAHSLYCKRCHRAASSSLIACSSNSRIYPFLPSSCPLTDSAAEEENHSQLENQNIAAPESLSLPDLTINVCSASGATGYEWQAQCSALASVSWEQAWQQSMRWKSLQNYLRLAIPGGFMVAMEAGSFDITTMFAGTLGVAQVLLSHFSPQPCNLLAVSTHIAVCSRNAHAIASAYGKG